MIPSSGVASPARCLFTELMDDLHGRAVAILEELPNTHPTMVPAYCAEAALLLTIELYRHTFPDRALPTIPAPRRAVSDTLRR